jgi:hypothetical protein
MHEKPPSPGCPFHQSDALIPSAEAGHSTTKTELDGIPSEVLKQSQFIFPNLSFCLANHTIFLLNNVTKISGFHI